MRKALIDQIVIKIGDREMYLDHGEAKALFVCLQDLFASTARLPLTIHQDYLYWIAPQLSWVGSDMGTSAFYSVDDRTLTLSLGLDKPEAVEDVEAVDDKENDAVEAPALDADIEANQVDDSDYDKENPTT